MPPARFERGLRWSSGRLLPKFRSHGCLGGPIAVGSLLPVGSRQRPLTVDDLLSMRLGFGFVFEGDCPAVAAAAEAGLGIGPPDPSIPLTPDAWIARFSTT